MTANSSILIVDDEPQIRNLLSFTLENAGYAVTTAANGRDAIAVLAEESFDLLLSDVMMPEMNGHQLAQWVASHHPETRTALMSGYDPGCRNCAYSPRCHLIAKPFQPRQVLAFVEEVLTAPMPS
uniref:Response regulator receiver protein n=1 Tax=Solibacter usitatus (strain Ellin6076) TaxID=234267 RepID=Q01TP4_SOLUE